MCSDASRAHKSVSGAEGARRKRPSQQNSMTTRAMSHTKAASRKWRQRPIRPRSCARIRSTNPRGTNLRGTYSRVRRHLCCWRKVACSRGCRSCSASLYPHSSIRVSSGPKQGASGAWRRYMRISRMHMRRICDMPLCWHSDQLRALITCTLLSATDMERKCRALAPKELDCELVLLLECVGGAGACADGGADGQAGVVCDRDPASTPRRQGTATVPSACVLLFVLALVRERHL